MCPVVLAAILFPAFSSARWAARNTVALSNAKQVDLAVLMYAGDSDDFLPPLISPQDTANKLKRYLGSGNFVLQGVAARLVWNSSLGGVKTTAVQNPESTWIFYTSAPDAGGKFVIGFVDGHVRRYSAAELAEIKSRKLVISKGETTKK
jgi:prepilin-type processing-associated H-X9-DG protein